MPPTSDHFDAQPCHKCGYDLRVTPCASPCPECGTPAEHSKLGYRVEGVYLIARARARLPHQSPAPLLKDATNVDDRSLASKPPLQSHIVALQYRPRLLSVACFTLPFVLSFIGALMVSDHELMLLGLFLIFLLLTALIADAVRKAFTRMCRLYSSADVMLDVHLTVTRRRAGEYWIKGFSKNYLDHCASERERLLAEAGKVDDAPHLQTNRSEPLHARPIAEPTRATSE